MRVYESERAEIESVGIHVKTGQVFRQSGWVELVDPRQRLIDILAADYAMERAATVLPMDTALRSVAATRLATVALQRAARLADGWALHADLLTADMRPVSLPNVIAAQSSSYVPLRTRPTSAQIIHATREPMRPAKWSLELEAGGSMFLRATGQPFTRPDVLDRNTGLHVTRPDHICHAAVTRFTNPQPCIYGPNGYQSRVEHSLGSITGYVVDPFGVCERAEITWPVGEYLTTLRRAKTARHYVTEITRDDDTTSVLGPLVHGRMIGRRTVTVNDPIADDRIRHGWRGHEKITWELVNRSTTGHATRTAKRAATRVVGAAKTGRNVGPWSMSARSLPKAVIGRGLTDVVTLIESALRTTDGPYHFNDGTTVEVIGNVEVIHTGKAWPVREFARRAALAGKVHTTTN